VEHVLASLLGGELPSTDSGSPADPFQALDQTLAAVPPGSDGVVFLPHLAGAMAPVTDAGARGAFVGLSLATSREHLVRAAVEGTALNAAWLLPAVEGLSGSRAETLVLGGGAGRSAGWAQAIADVMERPVAALVDPGAAVARAAALAALLGPDTAAIDAEATVVRVGTTYEPRPEHAATYREARHRFVATFEALRNLTSPTADA
jgi:xylulokinase